MLADAGMDVGGLPSDEYLDFVRSLADRRNTTDALLRIRSGLECATCGESRFCKSLDEVLDEMDKYGVVVVKALWSSSGRGVRYVDKGFQRFAARMDVKYNRAARRCHGGALL